MMGRTLNREVVEPDQPDPSDMTCVTIHRGFPSCPPAVASNPRHSGTISVRACSRKNRVYAFREFLLKIYGAYLHQASVSAPLTTVLDVAGGKGDLSWLLCNVDSIPSVIVDPRPSQHSHLIRSVRYLRLHPEEAAERAIRDRPTHQPLAALLPKLKDGDSQTPRHLRLLVDDELVDAIRTVLLSNNDDDRSHWSDYWIRASKKAMGAQQCIGRDASSLGQISDASEALATILSVKLVVGFHPDQATEACMDLAMLLNIPFCVVPCCVFPSEFPDRSLRHGQRVRTYEEFLVYLEEKYRSKPLSRATLQFHETKTARNVVLYTLPDDL